MPYFITVKYQIIMFPFPTLELFIENFFLTTAPQPLEVLKVIKKVMLWIMSYELWVLMLTSCVYCMRYELLLIARVKSYLSYTSYEFFLLHELRVSFCIRVTSYRLLHELRVTFWIRIKSYCFIAWVMSYFLLTNYELLTISWVTNFILHTS